MIKPHQFIGLAAASAVSAVLALGLYFGANRWSAGKVEGAPFAPELARSINNVGAVEITQGGQTLTLERAGQAWKLKERAGYPAKGDAARGLLVTLAQAQLIEPKTAVKDKLSLLELDEPGKDAKSRRVRVLDPAGKPISDLVLGKTRIDAFGSGKGGIYVRRAGEMQTWLATGDPRVTAEVRDWVETKVLSTDTAKISKVTIENPGETPLVVERAPPAPKEQADAAPKPPGAPKEAKYRLAALPDGMKLKAGINVDTIVDAFSSIDLDEVRKLAATPTGDNVQVITVVSEGGPTITFRLRKDGEDRWISLIAAGEGDAKKTADEINARVQGWEHRIPTWKAEQMGKRAADLFETS